MRRWELEELIGEAIAHPEQFTQRLPATRGATAAGRETQRWEGNQPVEPEQRWQARAVRVALEREGELLSDP